MRRFYLENEYAQRYALHQPGKVLFNGASGLGASSDARYVLVGNTFLNDYSRPSQRSINGIVNFLRGQNQNVSFQEFADFVYSAKKLRLIYVPDTGEGIEYVRDVELTAMSRGEIDQDRILRVAVEFDCKTLYYNSRQTTFIVEIEEGQRAYDYSYPARYSDYASRALIFNNTGHVEAPIEAEIYGYSENPKIEVLQNGVVVKTVEFPVVVNAGEKILYSTRDGDLYAYLVSANGTYTNLASDLSLNNDNFFKLPVGQSEIRISSSVASLNRVIVRTYKLYKVV